MKQQLFAELQQNIDKRLQRLEGQVRGVRRMLEEERGCEEVLTQLAAIRGAAHQISLLLVENYAKECLMHPTEAESADKAIAKMVNILGKLA